MNNHSKLDYKYTPLGWIPKDWEILQLVKCSAFITKGSTPTTYGFDWADDGIVFLRSECVTENGIDLSASMYISEEANNAMQRSQILEGDILMTITGNVGRVSRVPLGFPKANINQHISRIRIEEDSVEANFVYQYLKKDTVAKGYLKITTGQAYPQISLDQVRNTFIPVPPKEERNTICLILSTWDEAITKTRQLIALLQQRNKGLKQQLLTGKKRLKRYNQPWTEIHLIEAFNERNETSVVNLSLLSVGSMGVYPQSQSEKRDTSNSDKTKYKRISPGDIGYNTMRMWQGRSALSSLEGIVSPAYTIVTPKEGQHSGFYAYLFKLPSVINKFFRNSQGLVEDTLNCKFKDFAMVKVEVPEYEEQFAIANVLTTAEVEIKSYEQKLSALQQQKKGLMQKLLTGEIRVKN